MPSQAFLDYNGLQYYNQLIQEQLAAEPTIVMVNAEPTEQSTENYPENTLIIWPEDDEDDE